MTTSESKGRFFTKRIDSNRELECSTVQPTHDVSDHDLVTWLFSVKRRPPRQFLAYDFRSLKHLDVSQFQNDVKQSELFLKPATTTNAFSSTGLIMFY